MKLYGITEEDILKTMQLPDLTDREGMKIVAIRKFSDRFSGYPLKVVYEKIERDDVFIITAYPLKKKIWR